MHRNIAAIALFVCGSCLAAATPGTEPAAAAPAAPSAPIASSPGSAPASEASIKELLTVMDAENMVNTMYKQVDSFMQQTMSQSLGHTPTPKEQKFLDDVRAQSVGVMKDELNWDSLEPMYVQIYQESLTQDEIDGMIAFYKTPAGQAVIKKMPLIVRNSMIAVQKRMGPVMRKIQANVQKSVEELKKEDTPAGTPSAEAGPSEPAPAGPSPKN